jgi:hypothetical protein
MAIQDTSSFYARGSLLFFAILLNAFSSALEILTLYAQRRECGDQRRETFLLTPFVLAAIVEKHVRFAFYHASAEAFASMLTDMPYKVRSSAAITPDLLMISLCTDIEFHLLQYHLVFHDASPTDSWRILLLLLDLVGIICVDLY